MGQGSVDQVGEDGFDDGVLAVGDVGLGGREVGVGEERVVSLHREQGVAEAGIFDAAYHQSRGEPILGGRERGVGDFGGFGIRDPVPGVGITHRAGIFDRGPGVLVDGGDGTVDRGVAGHHQ